MGSVHPLLRLCDSFSQRASHEARSGYALRPLAADCAAPHLTFARGDGEYFNPVWFQITQVEHTETHS